MKVEKSAKRKFVARGALTSGVIVRSAGERLVVELPGGVQWSATVQGGVAPTLLRQRHGQLVAEPAGTGDELAGQILKSAALKRQPRLRARLKDVGFSRGASQLRDLESIETTDAIAKSAEVNLSHNRERYEALFRKAVRR